MSVTEKQLAHLDSLNAYRAAKGRGLFHYDDAGKLVDSEKSKGPEKSKSKGPEKSKGPKEPKPAAPAPAASLAAAPTASVRWAEWRGSAEGRRTIDTPLPSDGLRAWGELEARLKTAFLAGAVEEVDV